MSTRRIYVYWLECSAADLPPDNAWLTEEGLFLLRNFRVPKRRNDWRLGRWTAKQAVAAYLHLSPDHESLAGIQIRATESGAPEVFLPSRPAPVSISISHCNDMAVCAVSQAGAALGCDLEAVAPRSDLFIADYFVESEQQLIARSPASHRPWLATLLWSAKESALKALGEGLRLDTRSVEVRLDPAAADGEWRPLTVLAEGSRSFAGWWRQNQDFVRTVVACPAPSLPPRSLTAARFDHLAME